MVKNNYYLIARDIETNNIKVVNVGNNLEEIDLFTTSYTDRLELSKTLYEKGIIDFENADLFIVCRRRGKNKKDISYQEVLYRDSSIIKDVANASLNKRIGDASEKIDKIYEKFCSYTFDDSNFYKYALHGNVNLYPKFTRYFIGKNYNNSYSDVKNIDGGWIRKSYYLIRNVLETMSRYNRNNHPIINDYIFRDIIYSRLLDITDKDYIVGQIDMFNNLGINEEDTKIFTVIKTLDNFSLETFTMKDGDVILRDRYSDLEPSFNKVSNALKSYIQYYIINKYLLICDTDSGVKDSKYYGMVINNQEDIFRMLKSNKTVLDNAYQFCLLYNEYNDKKIGDLGGYQKRK